MADGLECAGQIPVGVSLCGVRCELQVCQPPGLLGALCLTAGSHESTGSGGGAGIPSAPLSQPALRILVGLLRTKPGTAMLKGQGALLERVQDWGMDLTSLCIEDACPI